MVVVVVVVVVVVMVVVVVVVVVVVGGGGSLHKEGGSRLHKVTHLALLLNAKVTY